jgi:hypothetical protein
MSATKDGTRLLLSLVALFLLAGCQTPTLPLNYAPSSALTVVGNVSVGLFTYGPAVQGKVRPNQIRVAAPLGNHAVNFDQNIDTFFKGAVFKELRVVGVHLDRHEKLLSGILDEFLIDDFAFHSDWTLTVHYLVTNETAGTTVYDKVKVVQRDTPKGDELINALNETVRLNIEEIIKDPDFIRAIH